MRMMSMMLCVWLLAAVPGSASAQEAAVTPAPVPIAVPPAPVAATEATVPAEALPTSGPPVLERADLEAWLDGFLPHALDTGDIAGAVVVVVKDGQVLLQKGYGYANLAERTPVDPEATLFRPGSVSKLFTWTAVMQLVEQGRLDLDADVNTYLKDVQLPASHSDPVTLRNLMTHTPGFEDGGLGYLMARSEKDLAPLGEFLARHMPARTRAPTTDFSSGINASYSNWGTA